MTKMYEDDLYSDHVLRAFSDVMCGTHLHTMQWEFMRLMYYYIFEEAVE
jgi:hypothetical protein